MQLLRNITGGGGGGVMPKSLNRQGFTLTEIFHPAGQSKRNAFTLAEVLITLGVIGVVAALTMPTLIAHYKDRVYDSQFKKVKSVMANAIKKMMVDNEVYAVDHIPLYSCNNDAECINAEYNKVLKIVANSNNNGFDTKFCENKYKIGETEVTFCGDYTAVLADGTLFTQELVDNDTTAVVDTNIFTSLLNKLFPPAFAVGKTLVIGVDLNGLQKPNEINKDLRIFNITTHGKLSDVTSSCEKGGGTCGHFAQTEKCNFENPNGCKTEEACHAIEIPDPYFTAWDPKYKECYVIWGG